ncbi:unnamed protein product [Dracunculus medinensis]|uniref:Uncharacterized protein n=1 Tax=Dracunculus medinensis TaxID=318479 RepID=A0A3P7PEG0_DRAME|nr:unnamed protein product [Dracunculus medinensis]
MDYVAHFCQTEEFCRFIAEKVLVSSVWAEYKPRRGPYLRTLKYIINHLEEKGIEVYDKIYYAYLNVQFNSTNHYCHRIFLNRDLSRFIALKEEEAQLSKGTTGLCCWQSACHLAHYFLGKGSNSVRGKHVLELGAGCGLVGIALAIAGLAKSITISDGNADVFKLLKHNISTNLSNVGFLIYGLTN